MAKWIEYKGCYICDSCRGHKTCGIHPTTKMWLTSRYCGWCGEEMDNWKELVKKQYAEHGLKLATYYETDDPEV